MQTTRQKFQKISTALHNEYKAIQDDEKRRSSTSPEHFEFLITYSRFNALLKKHGDKQYDFLIQKKFEKFLEDRWERIKNTNLAYPHSLDHPLTTICRNIAIETNNEKTNRLLMPSVLKHDSENEAACQAFEKLMLDQFILNDDNSFPIPVVKTLKEAKVIEHKHSKDLSLSVITGSSEKHSLTPHEKTRLREHSAAATSYYEAKLRGEDQKNDTLELAYESHLKITATYPESNITLWRQIIDPKYFDDLSKSVKFSFLHLNELIKRIHDLFDEVGTASQDYIDTLLREIKFEDLQNSIIAHTQKRQTIGEQATCAPLYPLLVHFKGKEKNNLLKGYGTFIGRSLQAVVDEGNNILQPALDHLEFAVGNSDSLYHEIWLLNRDSERAKLSRQELVLLTELTYRTALFSARSELEDNKERCIALANEIGQRSWGRIIGGIVLSIIGLGIVSTVIAASVIVSHGSTAPWALFLAKKIAAGIIGTVGALLGIGGARHAYRSQHHDLKWAALRFFDAKPVVTDHQYTPVGVHGAGQNDDALNDDDVGADANAERKMPPVRIQSAIPLTSNRLGLLVNDDGAAPTDEKKADGIDRTMTDVELEDDNTGADAKNDGKAAVSIKPAVALTALPLRFQLINGGGTAATTASAAASATDGNALELELSAAASRP